MPNKNWYQDPSPYTRPFPATHVISYFAADTITCEEPTISQDRQELKTELLAIQFLVYTTEITIFVHPMK